MIKIKKLVCFVLVLVTFLSFPFSANAYSARSMVLIEQSSLAVVDEKDANTKLPMASTTKIMTALIALETLDLNSVVEVPAEACNIEGSSMYLVQGERLSVLDLLYGLMLTSGNDAATALAIITAKTVDGFVALMNNKAKELGLVNTNFTNPSGLPDDNHYTTALELAKLAAFALNNPTFAKIVATKSAYLPYKNQKNGRYIKNHNKLLSIYDYAIGVKTGFTKKAGRCLVSAAKKDKITLVCVTLNAPDDWNDHISAYESGFLKVKNTCIAKSGTVNVTLKSPSGEKIDCTNNTDVYATLVDGAQITTKIIAPGFLYAPKAKNQTVGRVDYFINGVKCASSKLVTKTELDIKIKPKLTFFKYIKGLFK